MDANLYTNYPFISLILAFILSIGLALMIIPSIRAISRRWSLYDFDISQEVTLSHIPRHGGVALVVAFSVTAAIFAPSGMIPGVRYMLAAMLLLLAAGIQDDLLHLSGFMRLIMVVAAGAILTDIAGMPLFHTGIGLVFNFPLADLLVTYSILVGFVLLLLQASRIPGLLAFILLICSLILAVSGIRSGLPGMAAAPLALAGASMVLFFSSLLNYVYEGKASAMAGGFMLAILTISYSQEPDYSVGFVATGIFLLSIIVIPTLVLTGFMKIEGHKLSFFNKKMSLMLSMLVALISLIILFLIF